jgi:hypothetical protein
MGEKISTLGYVTYDGHTFEVELNRPPASGQPRQIHVQSARLRLEFTEDEFIQAVLAIGLAAEKLRRLKNIE